MTFSRPTVPLQCLILKCQDLLSIAYHYGTDFFINPFRQSGGPT